MFYIDVGILNKKIVIFPSVAFSWDVDYISLDISFIIFATCVIYAK